MYKSIPQQKTCTKVLTNSTNYPQIENDPNDHQWYNGQINCGTIIGWNATW